MKTMKKIFALVLVLTMVLALGSMAFAAGDGSITVKNATKGQDYNAYKVFDATYKDGKISYYVTEAQLALLDDSIFGHSTAADSQGHYSIWVKDGVSDETVISWVKENYAAFGGTAIPGAFDATNSTVTFSNLDYGYYYITSSLGQAVTVDSTMPNVEVYDKNTVSPTDPVKTIVSVDGEEQDEVTEANAHVGSIVGFKVTAKTTNWDGDDYETETLRASWVLEDTPTSMEIDLSSIVVKFNDTQLAAEAYTAAFADGKLTITVPMKDENGNSIYEATKANAGLIPIEITYSATITQAAGTTAAKNEIPGGPPVLVDTYKFELSKVDAEKNPLLGAKFEVRLDGTALTFSLNDAGDYVYDPEGTITQIDLTQVASAVITGLDYWDLTVVEVVVPEGYNQAEDIDVAASQLTKVGTAGDPFEVEVVNNAGTELPSTGGIGTTIFYVVGGILVLGALVFLVTKKRVTE